MVYQLQMYNKPRVYEHICVQFLSYGVSGLHYVTNVADCMTIVRKLGMRLKWWNIVTQRKLESIQACVLQIVYIHVIQIILIGVVNNARIVNLQKLAK